MKIYIPERNDWFVLPVYKSQMVYLLSGWYPADKKKFERMTVKRLRAIICSYVRRQAKLRAGVLKGGL